MQSVPARPAPPPTGQVPSFAPGGRAISRAPANCCDRCPAPRRARRASLRRDFLERRRVVQHRERRPRLVGVSLARPIEPPRAVTQREFRASAAPASASQRLHRRKKFRVAVLDARRRAFGFWAAADIFSRREPPQPLDRSRLVRFNASRLPLARRREHHGQCDWSGSGGAAAIFFFAKPRPSWPRGRARAEKSGRAANAEIRVAAAGASDAFCMRPARRDFSARGALRGTTARRFAKKKIAAAPAGAGPARTGRDARGDEQGERRGALKRNQATCGRVAAAFRDEKKYLPLQNPKRAAGIKDRYAEFFAPLKRGSPTRAPRSRRNSLALPHVAVRSGVQITPTRSRRRSRVAPTRRRSRKSAPKAGAIVLRRAQDTDPQQFAVLVEIARPPGAKLAPGVGGGAGRARTLLHGRRRAAVDLRRACGHPEFPKHLDAFAQATGPSA